MFSPAMLRPLTTAVLVTLTSAPLFAQDQEWGRKMFDRTEVNFGSVVKNADTVFKFKVKNIYKETIQISNLWTSCGCISWQDRAPVSIPTGETREFAIRLDTVRHSGDKRVYAYASLLEPTRGSTAQVTIPVSGRIRQDVVLQTNNLNFGQVEQGKAMEHRMTVTYSGGRPDWAITQAKVNNPHLMAKATEKSRYGGTVSYEVSVVLKGDAPVAKLRDQLLLVTNDVGDAGFPVGVEAQVEPDIVVTDAQFGQVVPGTAKTVNVVIRGKKPFKIEKIDHPRQDEAFKIKPDDAISLVHMIPLTYLPSVEHGLFEEEFSLTIAGREQPVTFKAKGRVIDQSVTVAKPVTQP